MFSLYVRFSRGFGGVIRCISWYAHIKVGCLNYYARPCNYNKNCKKAMLATVQQGLRSDNASSTLNSYSVCDLAKSSSPKLQLNSIIFLFFFHRRDKSRLIGTNTSLDSIYPLTKSLTCQLQRKHGTFLNFIFSSLNQR